MIEEISAINQKPEQIISPRKDNDYPVPCQITSPVEKGAKFNSTLNGRSPRAPVNPVSGSRAALLATLGSNKSQTRTTKLAASLNDSFSTINASAVQYTNPSPGKLVDMALALDLKKELRKKE